MCHADHGWTRYSRTPRRTGRRASGRSPSWAAAASRPGSGRLALEQMFPAAGGRPLGLHRDDTRRTPEPGQGQSVDAAGEVGVVARVQRSITAPWVGLGRRSWREPSLRLLALLGLALMGGVDPGQHGWARTPHVAGGHLQAELGQQAVVAFRKSGLSARNRRTAEGSSGGRRNRTHPATVHVPPLPQRDPEALTRWTAGLGHPP